MSVYCPKYTHWRNSLEREHFVQNFARRLIIVMQKAGFMSSRAKAGVTVSKLAEISGCSIQMARRYALGEALPDINTTYNIAKWLCVSPGWLLFGEEIEAPNNISQKSLIKIEPGLLEYILIKSAVLFDITKDRKELARFVIDIINEVTHIEADKKAILKIIDISINSAIRFNGHTSNNSKII